MGRAGSFIMGYGPKIIASQFPVFITLAFFSVTKKTDSVQGQIESRKYFRKTKVFYFLASDAKMEIKS